MVNFFQRTIKRTKKTKITAKMPFGATYNLAESKGGGANKPGRFGGVYKSRNERSLFKQDQVKGKKTTDDRPRMGKVLGEAVVGSIIKSLYPKMVVPNPVDPHDNARLEQARNIVADVRLVRANVPEAADHPDNNLYIQSIYIKKYQGDLWVLAYRYHYKNELEAQFEAVKGNETKRQAFADELDKYLNKRHFFLSNMVKGLEKKLAKEKNVDKKADLKDQIAKLNDERYKIKDEHGVEKYSKHDIIKILSDPESKKVDELFTFISKVKTSAMKRPSAVFRQKPREIVSKYLTDHPSMMKEFCDQMALRLLFGDRGVHNANFGVSLNPDGKTLHCCSLDYGTGFLNLSGDVDLYDLLSSGLGVAKAYKYHFREYPGVIYSDAMAKGFINAGTLPPADIQKAIVDSIKVLRDKDLNVASVRKICARAGMKSRDYDKLKSSKAMLDALEKFAIAQIPQRQKVFSERGYCLLLENCIEKGVLDLNKLKAHLKEYPKLSEFALTKFKKMKLTKSSGIETLRPTFRDPVGDWIIKNKIIQAVVECMPVAERIPEYQKMINYYKGRWQQAAYAVDAHTEIGMIKQASDEIQKRLTEVQDLVRADDPRLVDAQRSLGEVQQLITEHRDGLTQSKGVAFYGVESEVFEGKNREPEIQAKVQEYLQRPAADVPQPMEINQEDRGYQPKLTAPTTDSVHARVIHNRLDDGKKTFEVASVQRSLGDGTFKQEIHVEDPKKCNKLSAETYRVWGLVEAKNFLATTPDKTKGITLKGNWPVKLKRIVVAYCAILQAEQEAAKEAAFQRGESFGKEINYNCYDGATRKKLVVEKSEINYLKARLNNPDDRLALAIQNVDIPELKLVNQYRMKK